MRQLSSPILAILDGMVRLWFNVITQLSRVHFVKKTLLSKSPKFAISRQLQTTITN